MGIFFVYILKSAICVALFYLFYRLLLSRETFHRFNRFALLGLLLFSCLLPLVEVSVKQPTEVNTTLISLEEWFVPDEPLEEALPVAMEPQGVPLVEWMLLAYLAGILFFALRHLWALGQMIALLRSGHIETLPAEADGKGVRLVVHERETAPFSWMKFIVISRKDLEENGREILIHELAHISRHHSWDLLLADVCIFFQWFNPAAWLLKQELQTIHEYEADETVLREGVNAKQYQLLLIKKAVGTRLYSMANSFNHSKLKKRITMMLKEKSSPWARLKYLYVLPVAAVTLSAFARPEVVETSEEISAVKVNDLVSIVETSPTGNAEKSVSSPTPAVTVAASHRTVMPQDTIRQELEEVVAVGFAPEEKVYVVTDEQPQFPGGQQELMKYLFTHLRYPKSCQQAGIQGRVIVQFLVDKEGNVCNVEVVRKVHDDLDAEALRLVQAMPRWTPAQLKGEPVVSRFTLPIMFRLTDRENTKTDTVASPTANGRVTVNENLISENHPLIIINGKEVDYAVFAALNPGKIKAIDVLKGEKAVNVYGEKAKDGVILVTLQESTSHSQPVTEILVPNGENQSVAQSDALLSGIVRDKQGEAVVGAIVTVEGTKRGTVTDFNGFFKIDARKGEKLTIAYVGMKSTSVKIKKEKDILVVILKPEK